MARVAFCGVIEGSVTVRPGETAEQARMRAEITLNDLLAKYAKRLGRKGEPENGPVVGLEEA